jgi:surfactin synthase thioesterase subunit
VIAADAWLRRYRTVPAARLRLVCFPYAGGAANVFRLWHNSLPDDVEVLAVQYPGRHDRLTEPTIDVMGVLTDRVAEALDQLPEYPTVLFGHSMGASVAYEVTARLAAVPRMLVVSGASAPHRAVAKPVPRTEGDVIAEVREVAGPHEALADPELRALTMPALWADYRLIRGYLPRPGARPVPVPIVGYAGLGDPTVSLDRVRAWAELTTAGFEMVSFPGGHFFLESANGKVLADLAGRLST